MWIVFGVNAVTLSCPSTKLTKESFERLVELAKKNKEIRVFNLDGKKFGSELIMHIKGILESINKLRSLNLSLNSLNDESIYQLCRIFMEKCYLKNLNVSLNSFGAKGCISLATLAAAKKSITAIDLSIISLAPKDLLPSLISSKANLASKHSM
jgi:Ran GTPase-activating protein (RanGAP) involved in mRNA processing and transport